MDEEGKRVIATRMVELTAGGKVDEATAYYDDDAVVEYPQSGELVVGRANIGAVLKEYPGGTPAGKLRAVHVAGDLAVVEMLVSYPDGSRWHTVEILEFRNGMVARETAYFGQGFEPPEWRAKWVERTDQERT